MHSTAHISSIPLWVGFALSDPRNSGNRYAPVAAPNLPYYEIGDDDNDNDEDGHDDDDDDGDYDGDDNDDWWWL